MSVWKITFEDEPEMIVSNWLTLKEYCSLGNFDEKKLEGCEICIVDGYIAFPYKFLTSETNK